MDDKYQVRTLLKSKRSKQNGGLTGPLASGRVSASGAATLLNVKATATTSHTESVALVPPLSETPCSLCL